MFLNKIYPIGISYLAGYLKAKNAQIDLDFFDFNAKENKTVTVSIEELKENILSNKFYDFICFSLRQIDGFFFPERLEKKALDKIINRIKEITDEIKDKAGSISVIGGPGFSTYEKELSKILLVDYGVIGEGEGVLNNLINSEESDLALKKSGNIKIL